MKYVYVNDTVQAPVVVHDTVVSPTPRHSTEKKPAGIHLGGSEEGEWGRIDIDENGVRISGGDKGERVNVVIDAKGVRINGKGIDTVAAAPVQTREMVEVDFVADNFIKVMHMPKNRVQPFIDSIRTCYKSVIIEEEEDGSVSVTASKW